MQKFNKMIAKKYTTKSGEEKTQWIKMGELTVWDDGKMSDETYFEKPTFPWDGKCQYFPKEERQQQNSSHNSGQYGQPTSSQSQQNNQYQAPQNQQQQYQQGQQAPVYQENVPR